MGAYERILLTGGAGFVGGHLAGALARDYAGAARVMMIRPGEPCRPEDWTLVEADLIDEREVDRLVADARPDLVVHLAGQASVGRAVRACGDTRIINVTGSKFLAEAIARRAPGATTLFVSSASAYGDSLLEGPATEDAPLKPRDEYGRSKAAAEAAISAALGPQARLIVARAVNHSGWGHRSRDFSLPDFAAQIALIERGRQPPVVEHGNLAAERDFLDVRDVVAAYLALIAAAPRLPVGANVFNVASGRAHKLETLLAALCAKSAVGIETRLDPSRMRPADIPRVVCDASRLRRATGWAPRHSIDDMLQSLLDFWRAETADSRDAAQ